MTGSSDPPKPSDLAAGPADSALGVPVISSSDLLGGHQEIVIRHGRDHYRLRRTSAGKLILYK